MAYWDPNDPLIIVTEDVEVIREALRARDLFPRDDSDGTCVKCDPNFKLACGDDCDESKGYRCKQVFNVGDCKSCPTAKCVAPEDNTSLNQNQVDSNSKSGGPSVGVIVGAVIGGLVGIAAITFLVWWFFIRGRRRPVSEVSYDEVVEEKAATEQTFEDRRDQRSSMHTVHSIASTVLTRASNIIQIAYIPGVTNRATPTSPNVLVPPVPPIPITVSEANSPSGFEDQRFFMPGDLRDSTYSAMSGFSDRTSVARTSYAPRSSIASTLYGKNVVVSTPQTAMMVRPGVVSVRSAAGSSGSSTPPVPSINFDKYRNSVDSTFSIGEAITAKNTSTAKATPVRAQIVRVGSKKGTKSDSSESSSSTVPSVRSPLARDSSTHTIIEDAVDGEEGPFSDPPSQRERRSSHQTTKSLSAVIEEATRRAGKIEKSERLSRESSPFSDKHETKDA